MKVHVSDKNCLQAITPGQISAYLRSKGGEKVDEYQGKATIWKYDKEELLVPLTTHFADYASCVSIILQVLEHKENRSQYAIMTDLNNIGYDVIRVTNKSSDAQNCTLDLISSIDFVSNTRDMIRAAAYSAATHKICYLGRKPQKAEEFLKTVRFGQTERGSFTLQLLSPVVPTLSDELSETSESECYERCVVPTLQSGLEAMNEAAQTASIENTLAPFIDAANRGLTTNLCDAVCAMHDSLNPEYIEVEITYSPNRLIAQKVAHIVVDRSYLPTIKEASSKIKAREPEPEQLIRGQVTKLESNDPQGHGEIKIRDVMTAQPRVLSVSLDGEDYQKAISAHQSHQLVELSGIVTKSGRMLKLIPYGPLEIIPEDA